MKTKKIVTLVLIIIWMVTVFYFSAQHSEESSSLSGGITIKVLKTLKINVENEEQVETIETVIRKLAHYAIYLLGGVLILSHINLYDIKNNKKVLISQAIGTIYAITDEIHQIYVPGRNGEIRDVIIDSLGVITGIGIVLLIKKVKEGKNEKN